MQKQIVLLLAAALIACGKQPKESSGQAPATLCATPASAQALKVLDTTQKIAPLLNNLGSYGFKITTSREEAQKFFNQGLNLYYGFNHLEAYRSFREAARLDPSCAMCWWGQALSLGPNINAPMDPSDAAMVYKAVRRAQVNAATSTPVEQGLIGAIAKRYVAEAPADRSPLDQAYADAMRALQREFPEVDEVTTLTSEALMDLHPWDYWLRDGKPQPWTPEILGLMERVMKRSPRHPGANHLYIHINEASSNPGKAMASADLLRDLVPGSGHLVHMPSHIYIRTGRYADGIKANEKAVLDDEYYISTCRAQGIYPLSYYPHIDAPPLHCDGKIERNKNKEPHILPFQYCVDGYLLDSVIWAATGGFFPSPDGDLAGQRLPRTLGWNCIDTGRYAGHPSPYPVYYAEHPQWATLGVCWGPDQVVMWHGTGYPDGTNCNNLGVTFQDIKIDVSKPNCNAGPVGCYKILRKWTVVDWCTSQLGGHNQLIKVIDPEGPQVLYPDTVIVQMDVWRCVGRWEVPAPWLIDNCSEELH